MVRTPSGRQGQVRIIAGRWRGRRLHFPSVAGLRPTMDRVRETLFNWLAPYLPGACCLDLFAGSGALGLEALSRGAESCVAVESNPAVCRALVSNRDSLGAGALTVEQQDVARFLRHHARRPCDIVFLDPPHQSTQYGDLTRSLQDRGWVGPASLLYVETALPRDPRGLAGPTFEEHRSGRAGGVAFALLRPSRV